MDNKTSTNKQFLLARAIQTPHFISVNGDSSTPVKQKTFFDYEDVEDAESSSSYKVS